MIYNYHTHTVRCHHATDSDEDYIRSAIAAGIKYLGFSDHIPCVFSDGRESFYRVDYANGQEYIDTIRSLADKYKDQIHISVGFEMEYYPSLFEEMLKTARKFRAEYLIIGQHFIDEEWPGGIGSRGRTENVELLKIYVNNTVKAIESGVFTYVAHPDIIGFVGDEKLYESEMERICVASKEHNVPLEINLHGIRNERHYPCDRFFSIAGRIGAPVTFGYDAHECSALLDKKPLARATEMVKRHKLNYIGMPRLVPIVK